MRSRNNKSFSTKDFWDRIKRGDKRAREEIIKKNLGLVVSIAQKYAGKDLSKATNLSELIEAGSVGLIKAIDKFDIKKSRVFSTYASNWIKQYIKESIHKSKDVQLPQYLLTYLRLWRQVELELSQKYNRMARSEEILEAIEKKLSTDPQYKKLDVKHLKKLREVTNLTKKYMGIEEVELPRENLYQFTNAILDTIDRDFEFADVLEALKKLDERKQTMIKMRFGLGEYKPTTLQEIGKRFNLTRERVRQLIDIGLKKLRNYLQGTM